MMNISSRIENQNFFRNLKNILSLIALHLDDKSLLRLCLASRKINEIINDDFWRKKLLRLGMKNVTKENIEDPREAYKRITLNQEYSMYSRLKILEAASHGDIYPIKYLLEQGCQLKGSALQEASFCGQLEIVKYLVEQKADIHYNNDYPLRCASMSGRYEVVKYLVEQGANIHVDYEQPLYNACEIGHYQLVKYLIEQGADPNSYNLSRLDKKHTEIFEYLRSLK